MPVASILVCVPIYLAIYRSIPKCVCTLHIFVLVFECVPEEAYVMACVKDTCSSRST